MNFKKLILILLLAFTQSESQCVDIHLSRQAITQAAVGLTTGFVIGAWHGKTKKDNTSGRYIDLSPLVHLAFLVPHGFACGLSFAAPVFGVGYFSGAALGYVTATGTEVFD